MQSLEPPSHLRHLVSVARDSRDAELLVVTNLWPRPGKPSYGVFVERQVDSLAAAGVAATVVVVHGYRSVMAYGAAAAYLAWMNASSRRYAIVHAHGGESLLPARAYARAPLVVSFCGDDLLGTVRPDGSVSVQRRLRRRLLAEAARATAATITKSAEMESRLPPPVRARNHVVPNGVDFGAFAPMPRDEARRALGWGGDERVALFAADPAVARKRHTLAATAVELAARKLPTARLHVARDVSPEEMPVYMSAADCLVLTSTNEGSPNVVKEALACDLPVVATRVGDVERLLRDVAPSWLVAPTAEDVGTAVHEALAEPRRSNGRERSAWLRSDRVAERVLEVYAAAGARLARRPPPTT